MPPADANLLEVENLFVSFATESGPARVLDGVNLTIRPGEIMGLVGESGCGKTTLANAILGTIAKNARTAGGTIRFAGEDLLAMPPRVQKITSVSVPLVPEVASCCRAIFWLASVF